MSGSRATPDPRARRLPAGELVRRVAEAELPTPPGAFRAVGYASTCDDREHIAFVLGELGDGEDVLVRVHAECVLGDAFGALSCECGGRLDSALAAIAAERRGAILYLRRHGRTLGHPAPAPVDRRTAAQVLDDLGVRSMRLLTDDPPPGDDPVSGGPTVLGRIPLPARQPKAAAGAPDLATAEKA